ncbi:hypothetical protein D5018_21055 [Parashewanella curva]|uniref:Uncharacterized protein n=1 Tax=Parashewanella curva TaxID=2338552 RepID=A0A3L8PR95_9GAMM|nr:hypothetical protein [Parashewanella curva]RLV57724.1 hypothetical protein D5018_21055 [Parashewanella curva]
MNVGKFDNLDLFIEAVFQGQGQGQGEENTDKYITIGECNYQILFLDGRYELGVNPNREYFDAEMETGFELRDFLIILELNRDLH